MRGMTLIETVVSVAVVSVLLAGALNTAGAAAATRHLRDERLLAETLCDELMAEILARPYLDPDSGLNGTGPGAGEDGTSDRLARDDVDDFNGWKASPPITREGKAIAGADGLTRSVFVFKYSGSSSTDLFKLAGEVKIVVVRVSRGDKVLAERARVRAPCWDMRYRED